MAVEQGRGETSKPPVTQAPVVGMANGQQAQAPAGTSPAGTQSGDQDIDGVLKKYGNDPTKLAAALRAAQKETGKFQSERDQLRNQILGQQSIQQQGPSAVPVDDFAEMRSRNSIARMEPIIVDEETRNAAVYEGDFTGVYKSMEARLRQAAREEFQIQQTAAHYQSLANQNKELFERFGEEVLQTAEMMGGNLPAAIEHYQLRMEVEKLRQGTGIQREAAQVAGLRTAAPSVSRPGVPTVTGGDQRTGPRTIQEIALEQLSKASAPRS